MSMETKDVQREGFFPDNQRRDRFATLKYLPSNEVFAFLKLQVLQAIAL